MERIQFGNAFIGINHVHWGQIKPLYIQTNVM